jgi:hypothetical protein
MEVRDRLAAVGAVVDDEAEAFVGGVHAELGGDGTGGEEEVAEEFLVIRRGFADARNGFLGDDENVDGGLRIDVFEGEAKLVFVDNIGGDFAVDDLLEDAHGRQARERGLADHEAEVGGGGFLFDGVHDEVDDFLIEFVAGGRPFFGCAGEVFNGAIEVGAMDAIGFELEEFVEFIAEGMEEEEFEAGAGFAGDFDEGEAEGRRGGMEGVGDVREAELGQGTGDFVE